MDIYCIDRIPVQKKFAGLVKFLSTNSERKQAVCLEVLKGKIKMDTDKGRKFVLWEDYLQGEPVPIEGTTSSGQLLIYNAWQEFSHLGVGYTNYWQNGAAMIIDIDGNTRRYRCNDGHPDDNFDDIVFEVTIL